MNEMMDTMITTVAALQHYVDQTPGATLLLFDGRQISFDDVAMAARTYAAHFAALGLARGDRVALMLPNSPEFVAAYLGAHAARLTAVLINTAYRATELRHILADSAAVLLITDAAGAREVTPLRADLPALRHVLTIPGPMPEATAAAIAAPPWPSDGPQPGDIALLAYTSGTTGRAKGAMLSHANLLRNSAAVTQAWRWSRSDRLLLTLPLFHIHGLGVGLHGALLTGSSIDLRRNFDAEAALATLARGETTLFFGVPTMYARLLQRADAMDTEAIDATIAAMRVRLFVSGSAPLSEQIFAAFARRFGQPILERYGMTETVMNTTNPYDGERRAGTVGVPFPGQEARVVDVATRQDLPDGAHGEIQVRGPHVFAGYWRQPEATAAAIDGDGWFSTGDLGWRDADGYYTIAGRARELIISGGYNIYPREVEEVLAQHPAVREVAVVSRPDAEYGERVVAYVVAEDAALASEATATELIGWCRARLASYKKPSEIRFVAQLPRNALGKVQKHLLSE